MIVKNEEASLDRALASVRAISDEIVVVDTGSSDDTVAIAERHGSRVLHHVWCDDYAAARNVGLEAALGRYVLYIDADEELFAEDAAELRAALEAGQHDVWTVAIISPIGESDKVNTVRYPRVFRRYPDARFRYRLHEQIWDSIAHHKPRVEVSPFRIMHHGYALDAEAYRKKCERNLALALRVVGEEPDNAFYLYHVGLGHLTLGRSDEAVSWLERARLAGQDSPSCLNALGQAHVAEGRSEQAERFFRESAERCGEQHFAWSALGDLYLKKQQYRDAEQAFSRAIDVSMSKIDNDLSQLPSVLWMKRGMAQLMNRDAPPAVTSLSRALEIGLPDADKTSVAQRYLALAIKLGSGHS
jgi:glycosyltransferase involved in cell wall biosynthesis